MPDLTFDFTWYKDAKGYRLIPPKSPKLRPGQSIWSARLCDFQPARIVRNGGALQSYRPLEVPRLFSRFIDKAKSENGVLEFAERFGPLTHHGLDRNGDVVPAVIDQAENMSQALRGQIIAMPLNSLSASIVTDNGRMRLKVRPACLLDALWLQLAQAKSVTNFRECLHCHGSFISGEELIAELMLSSAQMNAASNSTVANGAASDAQSRTRPHSPAWPQQLGN